MATRPVISVDWEDTGDMLRAGDSAAPTVVQLSVLMEAAQLAGEARANAYRTRDTEELRAQVISLGDAVFWLAEEVINLTRGIRDGSVSVGPSSE